MCAFTHTSVRYREDPKTGLPAPYYGPPDQPESGPSSAPPPMMGLHTTIDPQLMAGHSAQTGQETQYAHPPGEGSQQPVGAMVPGGSYPYSSPARPSYYREAGPSTGNQPPVPSSSFLGENWPDLALSCSNICGLSYAGTSLNVAGVVLLVTHIIS